MFSKLSDVRNKDKDEDEDAEAECYACVTYLPTSRHWCFGPDPIPVATDVR